MTKAKSNKRSAKKQIATATVDPIVPATATSEVAPSKPLTMAERNAIMDSLDPEVKKQLTILSASPANVIAGTKGKYKAQDGSLTSDVELAKRSANGRLIPAFTPARGDVAGVSGTHGQEIPQLRRAYASRWGIGVIAKAKAKAASLKRELTASERDRVIFENCPTAAWHPRYNKDNSPALQYARHLSVYEEFYAKQA